MLQHDSRFFTLSFCYFHLNEIFFSEYVRSPDLVHPAHLDGGHQRRDGLHVRILLRQDAAHQAQPQEDLGRVHRRSGKLVQIRGLCLKSLPSVDLF